MAMRKLKRFYINRDNLFIILKTKNLSIRALGRDSSFNWSEKSVRRALITGASYDLVSDLSKYLNIKPKDIVKGVVK